MNDLSQHEIPGLTPQKKIELLKIWRKHLMVEHQYATCPMPQEEILGKFKIRQEEKEKTRESIKEAVK